jgi:hypothetical protein
MKKRPTKKRRVVTRSGAKPRGYFTSTKCESPLPFESNLEFIALTRFELDVGILSIVSHQTAEEVTDDEGDFTAYPDYQTVSRDGVTTVIEVKPARKLCDREVSRRLKALRNHYETQGIEYRVVTDEQLKRNGAADALAELLAFRHRRERSRLLAMDVVAVALSDTTPRTLADLAEDLGSWTLVKRLLANDILDFDLDHPLSTTQPVRVH